MITAVDTCILFDVFCPDPQYGPLSKIALTNAYNDGNLVICALVVSELASLFANEDILKSALDKLYIELKPISFEAAAFAGFLWRQYKKSGGKHKRIIADFLIASHALDTADCLLTRDRGFYRRYFKNLKIVQP